MKRCTKCWPESYDSPPVKTSWDWPWLAIILIALAVFVVFVVGAMVQSP